MKIPKILLTIALVFSSFFPLAASIRTLDFQQKPHLGHFSEFSPEEHPVTVVYLLEAQQGTQLVWCTMHIDPTDNMVNGFVGLQLNEIRDPIIVGSGNDFRMQEFAEDLGVDLWGKETKVFSWEPTQGTFGHMSLQVEKDGKKYYLSFGQLKHGVHFKTLLKLSQEPSSHTSMILKRQK